MIKLLKINAMLSAIAYPSTAAILPLPMASENSHAKNESLKVFIIPNKQNSIKPLVIKVFLNLFQSDAKKSFTFCRNSVNSPPIQKVIFPSYYTKTEVKKQVVVDFSRCLG